jgi:hypothetical protein
LLDITSARTLRTADDLVDAGCIAQGSSGSSSSSGTSGGGSHLDDDAVFGVKASLVTDWDVPKAAGKPARLTYEFRIPKQDAA